MLSQLGLLFLSLALPAFLVLAARYGLPPIMSRLRKFWSPSSPDAVPESAASSSKPKMIPGATATIRISPRIHLSHE